MGRFFLLILLLAGQLDNPLSGQSRPSRPDKGGAGLRCGPLADQRFKCPQFAFSVKVPFGWVDRTRDMDERSESAAGDAIRPTAEPSGSEVLLAVFEHPPEVVGDTINSALIIAAEPLSSYPGIKAAADYFGPITDLAEQRGFTVATEPYAVRVGSQRLIRGDFSRSQGKLTMWQSSLVMVEKRFIVSFTFVGGSDEEIDGLIEQLNFSSPKPK